MDDVIYISPEGVEVVENSDYSDDITKQFSSLPDVAKSLLMGANVALKNIEKMLYTAPAFVELVRSSIPQEMFKVILTDEQKAKIASGAIKLMTKKDGSLMANLISTKTKKIVSTISLEKINISPEITQAMTNYATQMQMAQIAEQIQLVQIAVEEVRQGQEYDRLATAYSCQQKLLQAEKINNAGLKENALLRIAQDAEDSRNLLMKSQSANVDIIKNEPESYWAKFVSGSKQQKIDTRMNEIRESLCAVNMVSLVEAMAYQEMGEYDAAKQSLEYYARFISDTYFADPDLINRLDMIDPSPENYWSKNLPKIVSRIATLPYNMEQKYIGGCENGTERM
ncbi:MAG: hypothetical protein E7266_07920 [Lachnospiraceae bacterium]|nr:hypothetical protein [Lachnospiraceae bacterium]